MGHPHIWRMTLRYLGVVEAGQRLTVLHVNYEKQAKYPLERVEKGQLNRRVERGGLLLEHHHPQRRQVEQ